MSLKPAILGGVPAFTEPVPFTSPTLPPFGELEGGFRSIIESGMLTKGSYLHEYEKLACDLLGVSHACGTANCTLGIFTVIKALGLTGSVIVPSFSFMATFNASEAAGLRLIFVDCEPDTFTIDVKKAEAAIEPDTSAIIGVNIFGNPPDIEALENLSKKHGIALIIDSAHSFGTLYNGHPMGGHGDAEVFSSSPTKLLATGEGGLITTNRADLYEFVTAYREYGKAGNYDCIMPGLNCRMSELHAFMGYKILPYVDGFALARNKTVLLYMENLKNIPGITFQKIRYNCRSSYKDFAIVIDPEKFGMPAGYLAEALSYEKVETRRYFNPPGHRLTCYNKYRDKYLYELKNTDYLADNLLNLPISSHMPQ